MKWSGILLLFCASASAADPAPPIASVPLGDFARTDSYRSASLSPDGACLAVLVPIKNQIGLAVIDLAKNQWLSRISAGGDRSILHYVWAGSHRLVAELADQYGAVDHAAPTGEWFAVDVDGKSGDYLFGFRGALLPGSHLSHFGGR